jgi:Ca-activated chloride channel family protein
VSVSLEDLERGASIQQLFDLEFPNHPLGFYRVAAGRMVYDDLTTGQTESVDLDLILEFSSDAARYSVAQNPRVQSASAVASASRAVEKTVMGMKSGEITQMAAIAELQKTQMLLVQEGRIGEAQEVTMALRAIQSGDKGQAEKTLMGTMVHLDQGKKQS